MGIKIIAWGLALLFVTAARAVPQDTTAAPAVTQDTTAAAPDTAGHNVFIVVIDGIRYSEAYPLGDANLPHIWNDLRPAGTIFTNFRNEGRTVTCPGHAAFLTGEYEQIANDGSERPAHPTLFEYYRSETGAPASACYDIPGKKKLHILAYSTDSAYGEGFGATYESPASATDTATWTLLSSVMDRDHPRLVIVNLPGVDIAAHDSDWTGYLAAMRTADSLVYLLWTKIQSDPFYSGRTTMFVSSDHGRHEDAWGGFENHGCPCEGCRHIIGLGVGPGFGPGAVVSDTLRQTDVQAAAAKLLDISIPDRGARRLLTDTP